MNNDFLQLTTDRFSCRHYSQEPVDKQHILHVIQCAQLAPSACNRQPWKFVVITEPDTLSQIYDCYDRDWIRQAPAAIIVLGNRNEAWHRSHDQYDATDIDIAITTEHICLAATELGLGTCWICNFNPTILRSAINAPAEWEPLVIIPIGHPAEGCVAKEKVRKPLDEILQWGKF